MDEETHDQACEEEHAPGAAPAPCDGAAPAPDLCAAIESCASVLGAVLGQDPRDPAARAVIDGLAVLDLTAEWPLGDDAELARAQDLLRAGAAAPSDELRGEYKRQFVGPAHFEAPQWASVYLDPDEVVFGNAHLELLQWMRANGIEGLDDPQAGRMPCDSAARELSLLSWLASNRPELMAPFVANHLMTWLPRYLDLLEETSCQPFWQGMAVLTRTTARAAANALGARPPKRQLFH